MKTQTAEFGPLGQRALFEKPSIIRGIRPFMQQGTTIHVFEGNKGGAGAQEDNELLEGAKLAQGKSRSRIVETNDDHSAKEIAFTFDTMTQANEATRILKERGYRSNKRS